MDGLFLVQFLGLPDLARILPVGARLVFPQIVNDAVVDCRIIKPEANGGVFPVRNRDLVLLELDFLRIKGA